MVLLRKYGLVLAGLVLVIVGAILLLTPTTVGFGWTAYAPLSSSTFFPTWPTASTLAGLALLILGLVTIAGWVGFRIGRDRDPS